MAESTASPIQSTHPALALWRALRRVEKSKINPWWLALRNSLAVAVPLAIGIEMGNSLAAVAIAIGALNVAFSDGVDPYYQRGQRMLLWSFLSGIAVFVGSMGGQYRVGGILLSAAWAVGAGMMLALSTRAGDLGLNTLVSIIVFAAKGSTTPVGALYSGLLVCAGGLLQTFLALLFWPLHRNRPELIAIGKSFHELAAEVNPDAGTPKLRAIPKPGAELQDALSALEGDHSIEAERLRLLYDQTDRLRLSIYMLNRVRDEVGKGATGEDLDRFLNGTSRLIHSVGDVLLTGQIPPGFESQRQPLIQIVERAQERKRNPELKLGEQVAAALDILVGQLRLVIQLAINTTEQGSRDFFKSLHAKPWKLQAGNWRATLAANMSWKSPVFRHAIRLSACITVAEMVERGISWQRAYWIPMTVAVVLKPDFTTTFARGGLRLGGTIAGLFLATLIFLLLPQSGWTQLLLVGVYTFFLRYLGPANYGVFTVAISGLIVFLLAAAGTRPAEVVWARGINTMAGGLLALLAYAIWPTWEKETIGDSLAEMVEASRSYFRAVADQFEHRSADAQDILDQQRSNWRLKRTAAEAAADRVASEPGNSKARLECLTSILASSRSLLHATSGLEAGLMREGAQATPEAFQKFADDVDLTLHALVKALKGSKFAGENLPQLREDHRRLMEARNGLKSLDEYVILETDRLTVSLNTLREQVARYVSGC